MAHRAPALPAAGLLALLASEPGAAETLLFADRSSRSGLDLATYSGSAEKPHILESTGNGLLVLDYDGDGYQDLYFVAAYRLPPTADGGDPDERSALYRNNGDGTFSDVTARAGVGARVYGHGGAVGDFDADGLADLYVTAFGANVLYRNNGDGTFSDVTERAGVVEPGWSIGATFFDADGDGDQDLFVANYIETTWEKVLSARRTRRWRGKVEVMDGPRGLTEAANSFFRNRGDGTFEEATASSGLAAGGHGYSMGVTTFDYDRDGDVDLYVANDSTPNRLYRNRGDGTFEEIGTWSGAAYNADGRLQGSMGVDRGDYDGDGWLDLVVTNFAHDYYTLYRNLGGELFQDDSFAARIAAPSYAPLGWGVLFFDADNDRDLDLFFANGHIYPQVDDDPALKESYRQANQLLLNERGRYRDGGAGAGNGLDLVESSRGAVYLDLENDGDLDLAISNQDAKPSLLENMTSVHHWLSVDLRQTAGGRQLLGAHLTLETAGERQVREISSGGAYASELDGRPHFGLAAADRAERLVVRWPDGRRSIYRDLAADRLYVLRRPGARAP